MIDSQFNEKQDRIREERERARQLKRGGGEAASNQGS